MNSQHGSNLKGVKGVTRKEKEKEPGDKAAWDPVANQLFLSICMDLVSSGNKPGTTLSKYGMCELIKRFNESTGRNYVRKQFKNHWDSLKKDWSLWRQLTHGETGLGMNHDLGTIDASDEWGDKKLKIVPEASKFRNAPPPNLRELEIIFNGSVATGEKAWTPNSGVLPPHMVDLEAEENENVHPIDDIEIDSDALAGTFIGQYYFDKYLKKSLCRPFDIAGWKFVTDILESERDIRSNEMFRMRRESFISLCLLLQNEYGLTHSRHVRAEEKLAMFLLIVGHGVGQRVVQEIFQKSGETVSKYFHEVLRVTTKMSMDWIVPSDNINTHDHIRNNKKYWPYFKDCIDAIDGTHVRATVPVQDQGVYIGRKGYATQNIMAVCDFDMCFIFVKPGWEGSAHDTRIFLHTLRDPSSKFPHPVAPKYYLVDAGYPNKIGYLAPYKGERFHLPELQLSQQPRNAEEKFNEAHSSLRSVIERTFGVWKAKWRILQHMPCYRYEDQVCIISATMAIHNFIRRRNLADDDFQYYDNRPNFIPRNERDEPILDNHQPNVPIVGTEDPEMNNFRNNICHQICNDQ